jgi:hypothetical protein
VNGKEINLLVPLTRWVAALIAHFIAPACAVTGNSADISHVRDEENDQVSGSRSESSARCFLFCCSADAA